MKILKDHFSCSLKLVRKFDEIREIDDCLLRSQEARVDA